jgi:hypothetical protein
MRPCQVLSLNHHINIIEDGQVEVLITAMVHQVVAPSLIMANQQQQQGLTQCQPSSNYLTPLPVCPINAQKLDGGPLFVFAS